MKIPTHAEDMLCYNIYTATHAINRAYAPHLKRMGLTYPQYITLTFLWNEDGQTVNGLAQKLGLETNTVTPLLKRLEALGHISRSRSKTDGRTVLVHLTPKGQELQAFAPEITQCVMEGTGMPIAELEHLVAQLTRLRDELSEP